MKPMESRPCGSADCDVGVPCDMKPCGARRPVSAARFPIPRLSAEYPCPAAGFHRRLVLAACLFDMPPLPGRLEQPVPGPVAVRRGVGALAGERGGVPTQKETLMQPMLRSVLGIEQDHHLRGLGLVRSRLLGLASLQLARLTTVADSVADRSL